MPDRQQCVFHGRGCRRTFACLPHEQDAEAICGRHWRMADRLLRDRYKRARRRALRIEKLAARRGLLSHSAVQRAFERANAAYGAVRQDVDIKLVMGLEPERGRRRTSTDG